MEDEEEGNKSTPNSNSPPLNDGTSVGGKVISFDSLVSSGKQADIDSTSLFPNISSSLNLGAATAQAVNQECGVWFPEAGDISPPTLPLTEPQKDSSTKEEEAPPEENFMEGYSVTAIDYS